MPTAARPEPAAAALLGVYRLTGLLATPFIPLSLLYRAFRGKETLSRSGERFGRASVPRPAGSVVWVHAASVGETNAVMPLIDRICATGHSVVFTCVTLTAAAIAARRLPKGAVHQFSPVDTSLLVGAFLAHWKPSCAIFVESELWPATIMKLAAKGVPLVVVNARLSQRSFRSWQRVGGLAGALFSRITLCLAQTARDGERYGALGTPSMTVTGNLKFDVPPPDAPAEAVAAFTSAIAGRPVWVAASTHPGEEEAVAAAHRVVAARHPGLLTIIVPRHATRGPEIQSMLRAAGYSVARRAAGDGPTPATEIYLADTMGELGLFYRVAPIAFLGGSLVAHGGQNPIEPIRLDTVILHGPHVHNFEEVYAALDASGGSREVADAGALPHAICRLLDDPAALKLAAQAAADALVPLCGAVERTVAALAPFLEGPAAAALPRPAPVR